MRANKQSHHTGMFTHQFKTRNNFIIGILFVVFRTDIAKINLLIAT